MDKNQFNQFNQFNIKSSYREHILKKLFETISDQLNCLLGFWCSKVFMLKFSLSELDLNKNQKTFSYFLFLDLFLIVKIKMFVLLTLELWFIHL